PSLLFMSMKVPPCISTAAFPSTSSGTMFLSPATCPALPLGTSIIRRSSPQRTLASHPPSLLSAKPPSRNVALHLLARARDGCPGFGPCLPAVAGERGLLRFCSGSTLSIHRTRISPYSFTGNLNPATRGCKPQHTELFALRLVVLRKKFRER